MKQSDDLYRIYVTDSLRLIASREGYLKLRYAELINPTRTGGGNENAEEIIAKVIENAGLVVD